ncbi:hypothetical protein NBH19_16010 [Rhizobium sp. S95]|uniref:Uncharacterized protein n=1 Tax=Ciceribacter sichuanensis TaxID=2949647 RepID=A0AAJ1F6R7_9HYPH|nr:MULTISPECIES: hypothetical protein [unclassified Ciceribacter]MCM2397579.1 hypothetical protein [Ciceribacter sp. S95]MCM2399727.1 hypothetical protein [Ciceribacter sp. S153]MCO5956228.1 hypothetical protein [Ciceribacter sp. S101]
MSYAGMPPQITAISGKNTGVKGKDSGEAFIEDWPDDPPSENDDFEGGRNWAMILIFLALSVLPLIGLALLIF